MAEILLSIGVICACVSATSLSISILFAFAWQDAVDFMISIAVLSICTAVCCFVLAMAIAAFAYDGPIISF